MKSPEKFNFNFLHVHFSLLSPSFRRWLETYSILRVGANFVAYVGVVDLWMYCSRGKGHAGCLQKAFAWVGVRIKGNGGWSYVSPGCFIQERVLLFLPLR